MAFPRHRAPRTHAPGLGLALVAILALPAIALAVTPAAAWQITSTPSSFPAGTTIELQLTVTLQTTVSSQNIGCVTVLPDPQVSVSSVRIVSSPTGTSWSASATGTPVLVTFAAASGADRLAGSSPFQSIVGGVRVIAAVAGSRSWTATAYANTNCSSTSKLSAQSMGVTVSPSPTPTPIPSANPTPRPSATPTPRPSPTPTPTPTPTPAPTPEPTPAGTSTAAPTPPPATSAPSASPAATASGGPDATATAGPTGPGTTAAPAPVIAPPVRPPGGPGPGGSAMGLSIPAIAAGTVDMPGAQLAAALVGDLGVVQFLVPVAVMTLPGLAIVLFAILAQAGGGLIWLPVVRRTLGGRAADRRRRRRT